MLKMMDEMFKAELLKNGEGDLNINKMLMETRGKEWNEDVTLEIFFNIEEKYFWYAVYDKNDNSIEFEELEKALKCYYEEVAKMGEVMFKEYEVTLTRKILVSATNREEAEEQIKNLDYSNSMVLSESIEVFDK